MEISATIISKQLLDRLIDGQTYVVHSCFSHGINLEVDGRLAFIGNKEQEILPFGIVIPENKTMELQSVAQGETFLWNNGTFLMKNGYMQTKEARVFSNILPSLHVIKGYEPDLTFLELDQYQTGFGESIKSAGELNGKKKALAQAIISGDDLDHILPSFIGAGPGLTPSGDDYITGILAANGIYHFASNNFEGAIKKLLDQGYTTDIAENQLNCAMEETFSGSWIAFLEAFVTGDKEQMQRDFKRILSYGHTSGRDMFGGFLAGLQMAKHGVKYEK